MSESRWYSHVVLGVLIVVALFNYIDRQALAVLQIPIKAELGLSDLQLGSLTGLSFAILYSTLALPIARLADRTHRVGLIAVAMGVWSLMTAASGFAVGMVTLTACRMGVAVGEAGSVPTTISLVSDYYPKAVRATAIAVWQLTFPMGTMLGFFFGGWLTHELGWRVAFKVLGAAGLCIVPLLLLIREPVRGRLDDTTVPSPTVPLATALRAFWALKSFRYAALGGALLDFGLLAALNWNAPFYSRVHGLTLTEVGSHLAALSGIGTGIGISAGGFISDRLGRSDRRWYMWVPAMASAVAVPCILVQYLTEDVHLSLMMGYLPAALLSTFFAPLVATGQSLVPANQRALATSALVLVVNLIGVGLGPMLTGWLSDVFASHFGLGVQSLRYALAISSLPVLAGCGLLLLGARHLATDAVDGLSGASPGK